MKFLLSLVLVLVVAHSASAQWLRSNPASFDRGHAYLNRGMRALSVPPEPQNWLFPNLNVSRSPDRWAQTEPSIAIDPTDPSHALIGYMDDSIFSSLVFADINNSQRTRKGYLPVTSRWADVENAGATDPSVAFNSKGVAYYLLGRQTEDKEPQNDLDLYVFADSDQAWHWLSCPVADTLHHGFSDSLADKYYLAIDTFASSPYRDDLRAVWIEYKGTDIFVAFASSSDKGASWSHVKYLSQSGFYTSPIPAITPDGTIIVTYEQYWDTNAVWVTRSTDGGKTFSTPQMISNYRNLAPVTPNDSTGYQTIGTGSNLVMVNSFPSITVTKTGKAFITWCGMGEDNLPHVYLTTSSDGGNEWQRAHAVDADMIPNAYSRYFPWISADPVSGDIGIAYYCVPSGPENMRADLYFAHSVDSGSGFVTRKVSSLPSILTVTESYRNPPASPQPLWFYGDYINLAGYDGTWYPVWTDSRDGVDNEIYTATVQPYAPMPVENACARDTVIGGQHAQVIRWSYTPRSTFGYGVAKDYFVMVDNGASLDTIRNGGTVAIDLTSDTLRSYSLSVVAGGFQSIPIPAVRCDQMEVTDLSNAATQIQLSQQPAHLQIDERIQITATTACAVVLTLYDELGREIGKCIDNRVSTEHTLRFTPTAIGASYYLVRGETAFGSWQRTGRFLTLPGE